MSEGELRLATPGAPRLRLGGRLGTEAEAIARAEAALKSLSGNFEAWMADELAKIGAARARIDFEGLNHATGEELYMRAHDLKGLGATYQYPIVTLIAGSLCKLIHDPAGRTVENMPLIDAHLAAIRRAVGDQVRAEDDPWAAAIIASLEARVAAGRG